MADGKSIEIKIAATGGDQAAAEVRKPADAASESASKLDENVSKIARAQQALALAQLAEGAAKLGQNFLDAADQVEEFDKDAAAALRDTARHVQEVGTSVSTVAAGFATGGPIGSALAALGLLVKALSDKWQEGEMVALKATASEKAAVEAVAKSTREAKTAAENRATVLSDGAALAAMDAELTKAKEITTELQRQTNLAREKRQLESEILDSKDQADLANVDLDEASGKLPKEQAAERRSGIEGAAGKRHRDERKRRAVEDSENALGEAVAKTAAAQTARKVANELSEKTTAAEANAKGVADYTSEEISQIVPNKKTGELSDSDKKFVAEMQAEVTRAQNLLTELSKASKEANAAAAKAENDAAGARRDAGDKGIRATQTISAIDQVQAADDQRRGTQSRTRQVKAAAEKKKDEDEAKQKEPERQTKEAGALGMEAERMLPKGVTEQFRKAVTKLSAGLQNGDQGGELKKLAELMEKLADSTNSAVAGIQGKFAAIEQKCQVLAGQIKNRPNR